MFRSFRLLQVAMLALMLATPNFVISRPTTDHPPKREFRGVWIATVVNIDWPTKANLSSVQQQEELIKILDSHQQAGMNVIMFQVRPSADALYANSKEPWSRFLTGTQGKAPSPMYDPLTFAIEEAHKRGMELHAWINPYRATFDLAERNVAPNHITRTHPHWFFTYGGKKWFNPGIPEVREYIVEVVMDIVKYYDVDGIHFDDYFYPYPENNKSIPDAETFRRYPNGIKQVDDWRRNNVNLLVEELAQQIRNEKQHIKFGISPFGIWDNQKNHPIGSNTNGFSGYRQIYADALKWMQEGWLDYINPQVYWPFQNPAAAYEVLVDWWSDHTYGKHLYIGHAAYRVAGDQAGWRNRNQLPEQIRYLRKNSLVHGSVYFSSKSVTNNLAGIRDSLRNNLYQFKSLPPTMPWLDSIPPAAPTGLAATPNADRQFVKLGWQKPGIAADGEKAFGYVIYRFNDGDRMDFNNSQNILHISFDGDQVSFVDETAREGGRYVYAVTAIDRLKNESAASNLKPVVLQHTE